MPFRDRTGPDGAGPGTGRGFGPCVGNYPSGYGRRGGMGFGRGSGGGRFRGRGFGFRSIPFQGDEETYISGEIDALEKELGLLKKRLEEIETDKKK